MNSWNEDDLRAIAESHDLYISPFREDGTTYGTPTLVWPLVVDSEGREREPALTDSTTKARPRPRPGNSALTCSTPACRQLGAEPRWLHLYACGLRRRPAGHI